jgi:biotin operon repressor
MLDERVRLFKLLGDKSRLKIVAMLMEKPMYVELISDRLGINSSTVSFHLKKLEHIGLVSSKKEQYYQIYYIDRNKLDFNVSDEIMKVASANKTEQEREENYKKKIIDNFFINGVLKTIPVQRKKRKVILEVLAQDFEIGKKYNEKEVNVMIASHHEDFCTLRREFIMEKLFTRDNNIYIRQK